MPVQLTLPQRFIEDLQTHFKQIKPMPNTCINAIMFNAGQVNVVDYLKNKLDNGTLPVEYIDKRDSIVNKSKLNRILDILRE